MTERSQPRTQPYGLLGRFENSVSLIEAIQELRREGYQGLDAFSPYPDEAIGHALGFRSRWLTVTALVSALLMAAGTYVLVWYSLNIDYPIVVGGKPLHGWPPFALIAFVMALIAAVTATFGGFLFANRLPRPYHPAFNAGMFLRASEDGFFIMVPLASLPHGGISSLTHRLEALGAVEIREVPP